MQCVHLQMQCVHLQMPFGHLELPGGVPRGPYDMSELPTLRTRVNMETLSQYQRDFLRARRSKSLVGVAPPLSFSAKSFLFLFL